MTTAVEVRVLAAAVDASARCVMARETLWIERSSVELVAFDTGAVDLSLLPIVRVRNCSRFCCVHQTDAVSRACASALVTTISPSRLGHPIAVDDDKRLLLTPRERTFTNSFAPGVTNREIGTLLYIEESTVKAHTHRIYDKLGVRSRGALTVQAALERGDQATSATESSSSRRTSW